MNKPLLQWIGLGCGLFIAFVVGVLLESHARSQQRTPIQVVGAGSAKVSAFVRPDFLWSGESWWIDVKSDRPLTLVLDGTWSADVPPGTHKIYSNHDVNNTAEFGGQSRYKTPTQIVVSTPP